MTKMTRFQYIASKVNEQAEYLLDFPCVKKNDAIYNALKHCKYYQLQDKLSERFYDSFYKLNLARPCPEVSSALHLLYSIMLLNNGNWKSASKAVIASKAVMEPDTLNQFQKWIEEDLEKI